MLYGQLNGLMGILTRIFFNTTCKILSHRLRVLLTDIQKSKFLCNYDVSP